MAYNSLAHKINVKFAKSVCYDGRVIDLGCGTAPYKSIILETAREYIGVDWKNCYHDQSNVDIYADIVAGVPLVSECADMVVSFQVMEHLREPDAFLTECNRILKDGGRLVVSVPFMWHVHEKPYDYFRYTRYGLEYLLEKNRFTDIQITPTSGFWQMWVLKFNYHTTRFAAGPLKLFWIPIWWLGQKISPTLDKFDKHPEEAAGYFITARKL